MPAAASENTPRAFLVNNLANRRCSERRAVIGKFNVPDKSLRKSSFGLKTESGWNEDFGRVSG